MAEEEQSSVFGVIVVVIFLVIIGFAIFQYVKPPKEEITPVNQTIKHHTINMFVLDSETKNKISANYILLNNYSGIEQKGFILSNSITQYKDAMENNTYYLEAVDDDGIMPDYYKSKQECKMQNKEKECFIYLRKEGNPKMSNIKLTNTSIKVWTYNPNGIVETPIYCFYYEDIEYLKVVNYEKRDLPKDLKDSYSFCIYESTIQPQENKFFDLDIVGKGKIKILLRDLCDSYDSDTCGIKDEVLTIII